jgi:enamine deaminase RidA (YjgF/YER057c/UK114 family)
LPQGLHDQETILVTRQLISSGSAFEDRLGYSRAVRIGNNVFVSGTAPIPPSGDAPPEGAYEQARLCLEIIGRALEEAGATFDDVVRTKLYLTDAAHIDEVGRAHREAFATARPACTGVIATLFDQRWLVEIEVDAVIAGGSTA